jgi:hypothetical protein
VALYNTARLIRGEAHAVRVPGTVAAEIKAGDNVMLVSNKAIRLSAQADLGTLAQNQEGAHDAYLGCSLDAKAAGETRDVLVATRGVHKFPCAALGQAYDVGTLVGPAGTGAAGAVGLSDYEVEVVATANLAIGKLAKAAAAGAVTVEVEIAGVLTTVHSGAQAMA